MAPILQPGQSFPCSGRTPSMALVSLSWPISCHYSWQLANQCSHSSGIIFTGLPEECKLFNMETAVEKLEAMVSVSCAKLFDFPKYPINIVYFNTWYMLSGDHLLPIRAKYPSVVRIGNATLTREEPICHCLSFSSHWYISPKRGKTLKYAVSNAFF